MLPRQGRYCSSNCSAPVTRRAKGTSFKAAPGDAFQNPPPQAAQFNAPLLGASNYAAAEIAKLLLPCSKLCAGTSSSRELCGRTLLTRKTGLCVSLKNKELLELVSMESVELSIPPPAASSDLGENACNYREILPPPTSTRDGGTGRAWCIGSATLGSRGGSCPPLPPLSSSTPRSRQPHCSYAPFNYSSH